MDNPTIGMVGVGIARHWHYRHDHARSSFKHGCRYPWSQLRVLPTFRWLHLRSRWSYDGWTLVRRQRPRIAGRPYMKFVRIRG